MTMMNDNKNLLFKIMEKEGNSMYYSFKPKEESHEWINSRQILASIRFLAEEYNGIGHYYNEIVIPHEPGTTIRLTYRFDDPVNNLLFRALLIENKIPYHTTGLQETTFIELLVND
jgi:hypothetical protein